MEIRTNTDLNLSHINELTESTSWLTQAFHQHGYLVRLASLLTGSASRSRRVSLGWASAVVLALISVVPVQGVIALCTASNIEEGENAKVSCHFDMDINVIKHDVLIYIYKNSERDPVFILSWIEGNADVKIKSGYFFDGVISEYIVINIPNATQDKGGQYKCIVAPSTEDDTRPCTLTIKGKEMHSVANYSFITIPDTMTESPFFTSSSNFSDYSNLEETRTEEKLETSTIVVIVVSPLLVIIIAAFVTIIVVARKKGLICSGMTGDNSNTNPNNARQNLHELQNLVPNGQC